MRANEDDNEDEDVETDWQEILCRFLESHPLYQACHVASLLPSALRPGGVNSLAKLYDPNSTGALRLTGSSELIYWR
jgi:hypothetical protein